MRIRVLVVLTFGLLAVPAASAADPALDPRIASRMAIEAVRHRHRIWPEANAAPKGGLPREALVSRIALSIDDDDRKLRALAAEYGATPSNDELQAELDRMARDSRDPERLQELWAALGNDPARIADALVRPLLVDRRLRARFDSGTAFDLWWSRARDRFQAAAPAPPAALTLPPIAAKSCVPDSWQTITASAPEARAGHSAIWTGTEMIVWGGVEGSHLDTGARYDPATDSWAPISTRSAPTGRFDHTVVWTGTEMIVYGGRDASGSVEDGARYDPAQNAWTSMARLPGANGQRTAHTAVWTGTEMIVWGGINDALFSPVTYRTGGRYNPQTDSWVFISAIGAPTARYGHSAIWTGSEMVVWGGANESDFSFTWTNTGSRYDPATGAWTPTRTQGAPSARSDHRAVWTGTKLIVWGGALNGAALASGGQYDPARDHWSAMSLTGAPAARVNHTAVWTGSRFIVWGGDTGSTSTASGGRYDPAANAWSGIATAGAPSPRGAHAAVWTGDRMIVFGGRVNDDTTFSSGGRYDPVANAWTPTQGSEVSRPLARSHHVSVWTGSELVVWGGQRGVTPLSAGWRYEPAIDVWTPISAANEPIPRQGATAVWTGAEIIVWGGENGAESPAQLSSGGRYDPALDSWTPTSLASTPTGRVLHRSVWTGREMIVWGGVDTSGGFTNSGGRYDPSSDGWAPTSQAGAPDPRELQSQSWDGREMIVWGGDGFLCCHVAASGGLYDPIADTWTPTTFTKAPEERSKAAAFWSGDRLVLWGGINASGGPLATGARYDPFEDAWTGTAEGPLTARNDFDSAWMCGGVWIWGGQDVAGPAALPQDGALYDPAADSWTPSSPGGAPFGRRQHTVTAGGTRAFVWGGRGSFDDTATGGIYCACAVAPRPGAAVGLTVDAIPGGARLRWATSPAATGYDLVRGDLGLLEAGGGDFAAATTACAGDDLTDATFDDAAVPAPGTGFWYLVRAVNASGPGTYDGDDGGQVAPRDAGIEASPSACP